MAGNSMKKWFIYQISLNSHVSVVLRISKYTPLRIIYIYMAFVLEIFNVMNTK